MSACQYDPLAPACSCEETCEQMIRDGFTKEQANRGAMWGRMMKAAGLDDDDIEAIAKSNPKSK